MKSCIKAQDARLLALEVHEPTYSKLFEKYDINNRVHSASSKGLFKDTVEVEDGDLFILSQALERYGYRVTTEVRGQYTDGPKVRLSFFW